MSTDLPARANTDWSDLEHYQLAHAFARNGFEYMPPEHPEIIGHANYWHRTPTAVSHQTWLYASDDPGYNQASPNTAYGHRIVRALRAAASC